MLITTIKKYLSLSFSVFPFNLFLCVNINSLWRCTSTFKPITHVNQWYSARVRPFCHYITYSDYEVDLHWNCTFRMKNFRSFLREYLYAGINPRALAWGCPSTFKHATCKRNTNHFSSGVSTYTISMHAHFVKCHPIGMCCSSARDTTWKNILGNFSGWHVI